MRIFLLVLTISGCSFISDAEHDQRIIDAQLLSDEDIEGETIDDTDVDGSGPVTPDDTGLDTDGGPPDDTGAPVPEDLDGDGYTSAEGDCDDTDPDSYPGAPERCDDRDNDCDGTIDEDLVERWFFDADGDGHGDAEIPVDGCAPGSGWSATDDDCDDSSALSFPGADEVCDGEDNNCDGTIDEGVEASDFFLDTDGDGYGATLEMVTECTLPEGYAAVGGDCDDSSVAIRPDALEVCNSVDDDCDGLIDDADPDTHSSTKTTFYIDLDGDTFGTESETVLACLPPEDFVVDNTDCNDTDAAVNPGAIEVCNGIDDDCNDLIDDEPTDPTTWFSDADGDGFGDALTTTIHCDMPEAHVADDTDCDDFDPDTYPGAPETGLNGIDNDCNGLIDDLIADDEALWSIVGSSSAPNLGNTTLLTTEDLNGNGISELLVSASLHPGPEGTSAGAVAFHESTTGSVPYDEGYLLVEGTDYAQAGKAIILGDIDGDGIIEIAQAGALASSGGGFHRGAVWIYDVDGLSGTQSAHDIRDGRVMGRDSQDYAGTDISAGDIDGDGLIDLVVGIPQNADDPGMGCIFLHGDGYGSSDINDRDATLCIDGESNGDAMGAIVQVTSDVTGDGSDDLIICASRYLDSPSVMGRCWLYSDPIAAADGDDDVDASAIAIASFYGSSILDEFGIHQGSIGHADFDEDDVAELVFGAPGATSGPVGSGATFIFDRGPGWGGTYTPADADSTITGGGHFGSAIQAQGNADGEPGPDLMIGAPSTDGGTVYLHPGPFSFSLFEMPTDALASWRSASPNTAFGTRISTPKDRDGVLPTEFAISAPLDDTAGLNTGKVWLLPTY
jgi:hypothetical protein